MVTYLKINTHTHVNENIKNQVKTVCTEYIVHIKIIKKKKQSKVEIFYRMLYQIEIRGVAGLKFLIQYTVG